MSQTAEEIKDASRTLPRAIMYGVALNSMLGLMLLVTMCFCLGDVASVIETPTGYPFIQIFYNTTKSLTGTNIMVSIAVINLTGACIAEVATASRQLWAFARDNGVPFSNQFAKV